MNLKLWNYHPLFDEKYQRAISMRKSIQIILLKGETSSFLPLLRLIANKNTLKI